MKKYLKYYMINRVFLIYKEFCLHIHIYQHKVNERNFYLKFKKLMSSFSQIIGIISK